MAIIILFLLGIGNFAILRAFLDSDHPALQHVPSSLRENGGRAALALEFVLLVTAMVMTDNGYLAAGIVYGIYAMMNGVTFMFVVWIKG